jgi:hypothetical protein
MWAFKNNVSILDEDNLNQFQSLQPFNIIYQGSTFDWKADTGGAYYNDSSLYDFAIKINTSGQISIGRVELEFDEDGSGQDVTLELHSTGWSSTGADGTTLKTVVIPKEFLATTGASTWSIPLNLSGLNSSADYWLILKKIGDAVNHFHVQGATSQDAFHLCYCRSSSDGPWTANPSIYFNAYAGTAGVPVHEVYGANGISTLTYSSGFPVKLSMVLPCSSGADGGLRQKLAISYTTSGIITGGTVSTS